MGGRGRPEAILVLRGLCEARLARLLFFQRHLEFTDGDRPPVRNKDNIIRDRRALELQDDAQALSLLTAYHCALGLLTALAPHRAFLNYRLDLGVRETVGFLQGAYRHVLLEFVFLPRINLIEHNSVTLRTHVLSHRTDEGVVLLYGAVVLVSDGPGAQREDHREKL